MVKKRKPESSPNNYLPKVEGTRTGLEPPVTNQPRRASTFPEASAPPSMERKPSFHALPKTPQQAENMMYSFSTNPNTYDFGQSLHLETASTPSLSSGISHRQESFPASPTGFSEQSFPLADLSAMMFPSADPFAYPNQTAAPAQSYDELIKNLGNDPSFPYPSTLEEMRLQRETGTNGFVPPSSTFVFNNGNGTDHSHHHEGDVQLLGPMPMYLMQGGPSVNQMEVPHAGTNESFTNNVEQFRRPPQPQTYGPSTANVNLDQLLGGEEWAGMHTERNMSSMGSMFTPPAVSRNGAQPFTGKLTARDTANSQDGPLSFDDLNPGVLGWNLDGF
jgi:hypothetical protein